MGRLVLALVVSLLGAAAALLPAPVIETPAFSGVSPVQPAATRAGGSGVSYCPWALADTAHDTLLTLASLAPATAGVSFPSGGEVGDRSELELAGPSSTGLLVSGIRLAGDAPAVVEFSDGPAAATALLRGPAVLAGDLCPGSIPKLWQLPGGSTREGERLSLRLFNPFPEDAKVSIAGVSEFGAEAPPQYEGLTVASRGWRDLNLNETLDLREQLALTVSTSQGLIVPALILATEGDRATWPGTGQSEVWELPLVRVGSLSPILAVRNSGSSDVAVTVDAFGTGGPAPGVVSQVVAAGTEARISLDGLAEPPFGVRVQGDGPLSVVVLGQGDRLRAATPGVSRTARRWLVPGFGAEGPARHDLWVLNSGGEPITVSIRPLDAEGTVGAVDKVAVPAGTIRQVPVDEAAPVRVGLGGVVVESLAPFSVAWSAEMEGAVAYLTALPVGD
ncbi:MAG: DUF5719 family protein [Acidimicrobiia bacterium]